MAQLVDQIQNSFTGGEISPRLFGRSDLKSYYNSLKGLLNGVPFVHGGVQRRFGSRYVAEVKTSANYTRLYEFTFSTVQTYVLEFGNLYFRIYRNRGQVISGTPVEVATPWQTSELEQLKFVQSADVLYVMHPQYAPRKITRTSDTSWSISTFSNLDGPYLPVNTTAVTFTPSVTTGAGTLTASAATFVASDVGRLVRIKIGANWGYARITSFTSSTVVGITVITTLGGTTATTEWRLGAWSDNTGWPECATFHEERLVFGGNRVQPQTLWGSVTGDFENFAPSALAGTVADTNAYTYTISSDQVNAICWLVSGTRLNIGTTGGEFTAYGGTTSGLAAITPTNITIRPETSFGSARYVRPKKIGSSVVYTQGSKRRMREMGYDITSDSYASGDITLLAEHITRTGVKDIAYQKDLESNIWCVKENGEMITFTYDKAQQVNGWSRHVLGGVFNNTVTGFTTSAVVESVACIPNPTSTGDDIWIVVKRTINGSTKRYVEYIETGWEPETQQQYSGFYVDSGLTYSGNFNAQLSRTGDTGSQTFTAGSSVFNVGDVGKKIKYMEDGIYAEATITSYVSGLVVIATINGTFATSPDPVPNPIPANKWYLTATTISGLNHLDNTEVTILVDGATHAKKTVTSGAITLDKPGGVVHVGLEQEFKMQTLPVEVSQVGTIRGRRYKINKTQAGVNNTLGFKYGQYDDSSLTQILNGPGLPMNAPPALLSEIVSLDVGGDFLDDGSLIIKETLPIPVTILYLAHNVGIYGD